MLKQSYQVETKESDSKEYVLVFVKNEWSILTVQKIIKTFYYVKRTEIVEAEKTSSGEKTKAICVYPTENVTTQDLKHLIKEVLNDREVLTMRGCLLKRRDILEDYDRVIMKMVKNEWNPNLVVEMQKLLGVILGDFTVSSVVSSINQICETLPIDDNDTFITQEKTMALFNAINKYILACANNTITV